MNKSTDLGAEGVEQCTLLDIKAAGSKVFL